jgi:peptidoglycan hydrolase-like protein with peptidoglycan-binding domain
MNKRANGEGRTARRMAGVAIGAAVLLGGAFVVGREAAGGGPSNGDGTTVPPTITDTGSHVTTTGATDFIPTVTTIEPPTSVTVTVPATIVDPSTTAPRATHTAAKPPTTPPATEAPTTTAAPAASHQVAVVQQLLNETGVSAPLPVDGLATQSVIDATVAFQAAFGLPSTGVIDAATLAQLKKAAVNAVLAGTWAGPVFFGGSLLGQLMAAVSPGGSTAISFSYSACVGSSSYVDFDGVTLTSNITLQTGADCTTITNGVSHLRFANINQLTWVYTDGSSGTLTRL